MPLPCMRPDAPTFEHETEIVLESPYGYEFDVSYDCRIEFTVAADDSVNVEQVDVWFGSRKHGRWYDARNVLEPDVAECLHEQAQEMDEMLFDKVAVEVEDWRAERARESTELQIDSADARGHAHRERIAEQNWKGRNDD